MYYVTERQRQLSMKPIYFIALTAVCITLTPFVLPYARNIWQIICQTCIMLSVVWRQISLE